VTPAGTTTTSQSVEDTDTDTETSKPLDPSRPSETDTDPAETDTDPADTDTDTDTDGTSCSDIECKNAECFDDDCLTTAICVEPAPLDCRTCLETACPDLVGTTCEGDIDCIDLTYETRWCGDATTFAEPAWDCLVRNCETQCERPGFAVPCECV
jgi:hypothetical protein